MSCTSSCGWTPGLCMVLLCWEVVKLLGHGASKPGLKVYRPALFPAWALCLLTIEGCKPCLALLRPQMELLATLSCCALWTTKENKLLFLFRSGILLQLWGKQQTHKMETERWCVGLGTGLWEECGKLWSCGLGNPWGAVSRVCWAMLVGGWGLGSLYADINMNRKGYSWGIREE